MIKVACGVRGCWPISVTTTERITTTKEAVDDITETSLHSINLFENIPIIGTIVVIVEDFLQAEVCLVF